MSYHGPSDNGVADVRTRSTKDGPWCWENKNSLRHIRDNIDPWRVPLAAYKSLCEIASNRGSDEFLAGLTELGNHCGYNSRTTLGEAIDELEFFGLIEVTPSRAIRKSRKGFRGTLGFRILRCEAEKSALPKPRYAPVAPRLKLPLPPKRPQSTDWTQQSIE